MTLSIVMITYNSADVVEGALQSIRGLWDELLVGDGGSTDGTVEMVKKYGGKVINQEDSGFRVKPGMTQKNLGERKQELVERAKGPASTRGGSSTRGGDWILVLDADERLSRELKEDIRKIIDHHKIMLEHNFVMTRNKPPVVAYKIPYQNYVFGGPVHYGGEKYAKVRLFRTGFAKISPEPLHEEVKLDPRLRGDDQKGRGDDIGVGELKGVIHHHSYRTPWQLFAKFTRYAWVAAGVILKKQKPGFQGAKPGFLDTFKKLFLYGPHMFWARFVEEKGYKDGWRGFVLAFAFNYMEGLTYWLAFIKLIFIRPPHAKAKGVAFNTKKS